MVHQRDTLGRWQAIANIIAAIVVPFLLAYVGWVLQFQQAESARSQEFVKMALNILADDAQSASDELKSWAVKIIDVESPVPLSKDLSLAIKSGSLHIRQYIKPPEILLESPLPIPKLNGKTGKDLIDYVLELQSAYKINNGNHEALLEWLKTSED